MVKRICILFPDASISVMSGALGEGTALAQARREVEIFNKGARSPDEMAMLGEMEINLNGFRERC